MNDRVPRAVVDWLMSVRPLCLRVGEEKGGRGTRIRKSSESEQLTAEAAAAARSWS
jgi:hypothetical protein